MAPRDPRDAALPVIRSSVDDLGASLAIWSARTEPDAHARRAANDAMDAVDRALAELHALRSRLLSEVRASDDQAAARVDALLARTRDGPRGSIPGAAAESPKPFAEVNASAAAILGQRGASGRAPEAR